MRRGGVDRATTGFLDDPALATDLLRALDLDPFSDTINPNGGAIALGHPLGMTGARILLAAARQLQRTRGRYGLVTLCIGVGQGYAAVIENTTR